MNALFAILSLIFSLQALFAADLGYRYDPYDGVCKNAKQAEGLNSSIEAIECADFRNVRIATMNLTGARLLGINISMPIPTNCHDQCESYWQDYVLLEAADARGLVAEKTGFINANFAGALLEKARFSGAMFRARGVHRTTFERANLRKADFKNASFESVDFKNADLRGADFQNAIFQDCIFQNAVFDEHTRFPFSKDTAIRLGLQFIESGKELPVDDSGTVPPPTFPPIMDRRVFESERICETVDDCQRVFGSQSIRKVLTTKQEVSWELVFKNADGTLWHAPSLDFFLWRSSKSKMLPVVSGEAYCNALTWPARLPTIEEFRVAADQGLRSLFSEVQDNQYWSSSEKDPGSRKDLYYFFDGRSGTSQFFDFGFKPAHVLCLKD